MNLIQMDNHWIPVGFHGSFPYTQDLDIAETIEKLIRKTMKRVPPEMRPQFLEAKYIIDNRPEGQVLTFEVTE